MAECSNTPERLWGHSQNHQPSGKQTDPMRCDYMPVRGGRPKTGQFDALLGCKVTWPHGKQFRKHFLPHAYLVSRTHQLHSQYFLKGRGTDYITCLWVFITALLVSHPTGNEQTYNTDRRWSVTYHWYKWQLPRILKMWWGRKGTGNSRTSLSRWGWASGWEHRNGPTPSYLEQNLVYLYFIFTCSNKHLTVTI